MQQIQELIHGNQDLSRTQVADRVCEQFGFFDIRGQRQRAGCLKALREQEGKGLLVLPASDYTPRKRLPIRLGAPVPEPEGVPTAVKDVAELRLNLVEADEQRRIWNEMMAREHPRGAPLLVGRQLRYLIGSLHGWLGGVGFGAAAVRLQDRDNWIGWEDQARREHLQEVVCMSRFLVRPSVSCQNLASRLLGMCMQVLPEDFQRRYGYKPVLVETFVDGFPGTCYRATNWIYVGQTRGRGRQDRFIEKAETVKDIYVYPLGKDFRLSLGVPADRGKTALEITDGMDSDHWAEQEFGAAALGDIRLSKRLVAIAQEKAQKPGHSYTAVVEGDWAKVKAYYRLIDKPDESAVTMESIMAVHRDCTIRRMKAQKIVLCIQDGTDLNYSNLSQCEGLGVIGSNQTGAQSGGLHLHSTMAVTTDGLPLGVLRSACSAPEAKENEDKRTSASIPIEEKKTFCWIEGYRDLVDVAQQIPETRLISVMDREADLFELFQAHDPDSNVDLLVRAKHDRVIAGERKLFDTVRQTPVQAKLSIQVDRQSARPKKSKQKAKPKRPQRTAELCLRYTQVELPAPSHRPGAAPLCISVVHVSEDNPPPDADPIKWSLLTTRDIASVDDAIECVHWYCKRWRIEDWHRVVKSGCHTEHAAHKTAERLKRALAINLVIAWRIMLMCLLGREVPELPAEILFSDLELDVLQAYRKKNAKRRFKSLERQYSS